MKQNGTDKDEWKKTARKIRRFNEKLVYDLKFAYVRTGHIKNEFLGFLTVFNAKRSRLVRTERHVRSSQARAAATVSPRRRLSTHSETK